MHPLGYHGGHPRIPHKYKENHMHSSRSPFAWSLLAVALAGSAHATNGMNLEGYGPIALGMGGASMAYDNGLAAMMNNPATLGLMPQGSQVGVALHYLGPDVDSSCAGGPCAGMTAPSGGDAYFMPAAGWVRKDGALTYGVGMYAQGGMGTEYAANSFMAMGTGQPSRSELGVGRLLFPLAYAVAPNLVVGGTLDFVWAGLDMRAALGPGGPRIDFSDDSDFTGKAKAHGFAGKLGLVYRAAPSLDVGLTYHSHTNLSDLETSNTGATFAGMVGKVSVHDFQWPETYAVGVAWRFAPAWMLALDVKHIGWSEDMKNFRLAFTPLGGAEIPLTMAQNWHDQNVLAVGLQYRVSDQLGLRAGYNRGKNPVPDATVNPLFPAIVEQHFTAGFDYMLDKANGIAAALSYAPAVEVSSAGGIDIRHAQLSGMVSYGHAF